MKFKSLSAVIAALLSANTFAENSSTELPSMLISADFRPSLAQETPISLTTIDSDMIESRGAQHIEDVLNLAPNVNISSGASRGQYFQIRGIGERSQFAAPINPSVGLIIDGIDFSRTGGAATLFDIEQVEILRGPQGTKFGTNALAGVINMQSKQPTEDLEIHVETGIAEYDTHNLGVAIGGALVENKLLGRASIHSQQSDGYMDNEFLNRDDTQDRDEITARGQLKWLVSDDLTVDLNVLHLNIDNGYDAFTFDNSRNTLTDEPGEDKQRTNAFALKTDWRASDAVQLQSAVTYVKSDVTYSYDADWDNNPAFNAFEEFNRNRENYSLEVKALSNEQGRIFKDSTEWAIGLYYLSQNEDLDLNSDFGNLDNSYETENTSIFGQLDTHLNEKLTLISGLRVEYFTADYADSNSILVDLNEVLFGGKLGLNYQLEDNQLIYTALSRGYKSGGVNNKTSLLDSQREFETEYMWNLEAGVKSSWLEGDLVTNITAFYSLRRDAQVQTSVDIGGGNFKTYIANAAKGTNYGIEADLNWSINHQWRLLASVGLLNATFDEYDNPDLSDINVKDRRQAHAPAYTFSIGSEYYFESNWIFRANIEGKDEFYYSNSHNSKSSSYAIVNSSLDYRNGNWKVSLWGRNLFDKDYYTRGFFFDNTPPAYDGSNSKTYTQYGDPRVVGINLTWDY
ncbi:MAG: TonB-dependent receptor [Methylophaga sp.]|nr:TonB-dependent receptor [Methylophaga sp.]